MEVTRILALLFVLGALCLSSCKSYDVNHVVHLGQSLGAGVQSLPLVTDSITGYGNLKFAMGTHTWSGMYYPDQPHLRAYSGFQFVPLTANRRGSEGETIGNGLCDHFKAKSKIKGNLLFSYAGQGGRYLRELDKRHDDAKDERAKNRQSKGGYYKTSIDDISRAKKISDSLDLSYGVMAITWMQGESNNDRRLNRWSAALKRKDFIEAYKKDLIQLKNDYDQDISDILKKKMNIPFFTYQTLGSLSGAAQLAAAAETKKIFMVGPTYMMPSAENGFYKYKGKNYRGAKIHLSADAERWLGEQFGKVIKRVLVDKKDWKPLRPEKVYRKKSKKEVFVKFHVPEPPLVLDTLFLPKQGNTYGFAVYDAKKRLVPIDHVAVQNKTTVKITLKKETDEDIYLSYGKSAFAKNLAYPIFKIHHLDSNEYGFKLVAIEFQGDHVSDFITLLDEGVFNLNNRVKEKSERTSLLIRRVFLNDQGNTLLIGEENDLNKGIAFQIGQSCYVSRIYPYGNLRDSDATESIFTFSDVSYGSRANKKYPLYNWSVYFDELWVEDQD